MSKALCNLAGGDLRTSPLAAILIEALRTRASGELLIEANGGISRVYFRNGQPCGAEIFFGFKPLGQFLLEIGWIDIRALERSLVAVADGRKQGEALVSLGFLTEEQLSEALALHHLGHLRSLSKLSQGLYRFTQKQKAPSWTEEIRISAHRAIVDALSVPSGMAICRRILRAAVGRGDLKLRPGWERYAGYFHLDEAEGIFLSKLVEPRALSEILALPGLELTQAYALTSALFLMGMLAPVPEKGEPSQPLVHTPIPEVTPGPGTPGPVDGQKETTPAGQEGFEERRLRMVRRAIESIGSPLGKPTSSRKLRLPPDDVEGFARWVGVTMEVIHELTPFERLGLEEGAGIEQVKRAYIQAAKRLHPDRIPPSLGHLREDIRKIFVAIGDAYETLRSGDAKDLENAKRFQTLMSRGLAALAACRWEEAAQTLALAAELQSSPEAHAHALWAAYNNPKTLDPDESRRELERLYDAFPESDVVCYYTGALARLEGDLDRAEARFRAAIERNPEHREARQELRLLEIQKARRGSLRR